MAYLIDSDVSIAHLENNAETVALLERLSSDGVFISLITYMELYQGWLEHPERTSASKLDQFVVGIPIITLSEDIVRRCAFLRMTLSNQGRRVRQRALDLLIAATAIEHNLTLVTRNVRDYRDIPGLVLFEGWS